MPNARLALILPPCRTSTGDTIASAARRRQMRVVRLDGHEVPSNLNGRSALYAARLFGDIVGAALDLGLLEPPPSWLTTVPRALVGRHVQMVPISEAWQLRRPMFVKPADGKAFPARVYADGTYLPGGDAVGPDALVLVSEQVRPDVEYRLFVLDGEVTTGSRYATGGELDVAPLLGDPAAADVSAFTTEVLQATAGTLPSAVVVDVGRITLPGRTASVWAVTRPTRRGAAASTPATRIWYSTRYFAPPDH